MYCARARSARDSPALLSAHNTMAHGRTHQPSSCAACGSAAASSLRAACGDTLRTASLERVRLVPIARPDSLFVHTLRYSSATAASCASRGFRLSVHTLYCCAHAKNPSTLNGSMIALFCYSRYTQRHQRVSQAPKAVALGIWPHNHRVFARCAQINGTTVKHKARTPALCARGRGVWRSSRSSKARVARCSGRGRGC